MTRLQLARSLFECLKLKSSDTLLVRGATCALGRSLCFIGCIVIHARGK